MTNEEFLALARVEAHEAVKHLEEAMMYAEGLIPRSIMNEMEDIMLNLENLEIDLEGSWKQ